MRTADLQQSWDRGDGVRWTLWHLSSPLTGYAPSPRGPSALAIYFVLTVERDHSCRVLESNSKGQLCAWGAFTNSRSESAVESLRKLGYEVSMPALQVLKALGGAA